MILLFTFLLMRFAVDTDTPKASAHRSIDVCFALRSKSALSSAVKLQIRLK